MAQANVIAPRLPNPPVEYTQAYAEQLLRVISLYFNQLDNPGPISAANLKRAYFTGDKKDMIALEFDQPVVWSENLVGQFYLDDEKDKVASGSVKGNVLTLTLKEASSAKLITYLKETSWSQDNLLMGANGIAVLTFCGVTIEK